MIDFDLSKVPFGGKLPKEDQMEFERRAHIVDDNNDPPTIIDEAEDFTETSDKNN